MKHEYAVLPHVPLMPGSTTVRPDRARHLPLDAPATEVMTDFRDRWAVTVEPGESIDDALERMKKNGVRMLLVVGEREEVVGLVTATDIQGERPVQLVREGGLTRAGITVAHIMVPQSAIEVFTYASVANARVGHVVATLHALERQHGLVVEVDDASGAHAVRGVFSTTEIGKRIGRAVSEVMSGAHSLAELTQVRHTA